MRIVTGSEVARTFRASGVPLFHFGPFGAEDQFWDMRAFQGTKPITVIVGLFRSEKLAEEEATIGTAGFTTPRGQVNAQVFFSVGNIDVFLSPSAPTWEKKDVLTAMARLERGNIPPAPSKPPPIIVKPYTANSVRLCLEHYGFHVSAVTGSPEYQVPPSGPVVYALKWSTERSKYIVLEFARTPGAGRRLLQLLQHNAVLDGSSAAEVREDAGRLENMTWYLGFFGPIPSRDISVLRGCAS